MKRIIFQNVRATTISLEKKVDTFVMVAANREELQKFVSFCNQNLSDPTI